MVLSGCVLSVVLSGEPKSMSLIMLNPNILQLNLDLRILAHYVLYISLPETHLEHIKADIIENKKKLNHGHPL